MSYKRKFESNLVIDPHEHSSQDLTDLEVDSPQNRSISSTTSGDSAVEGHSNTGNHSSNNNSSSGGKKQKVVVLNRWNDDENSRLIAAIEIYGENNWRKVSEHVATRDSLQCRQRWQKTSQPGILKGKWSTEEDQLLVQLVMQYKDSWTVISDHLQGRTSKQCRERWYNHLSPDVNKNKFTLEQDVLLVRHHCSFGNRWSKIAAELSTGHSEIMVRSRIKILMRRNQYTAIIKKYGFVTSPPVEGDCDGCEGEEESSLASQPLPSSAVDCEIIPTSHSMVKAADRGNSSKTQPQSVESSTDAKVAIKTESQAAPPSPVAAVTATAALFDHGSDADLDRYLQSLSNSSSSSSSRASSSDDFISQLQYQQGVVNLMEFQRRLGHFPSGKGSNKPSPAEDTMDNERKHPFLPPHYYSSGSSSDLGNGMGGSFYPGMPHYPPYFLSMPPPMAMSMAMSNDLFPPQLQLQHSPKTSFYPSYYHPSSSSSHYPHFAKMKSSH